MMIGGVAYLYPVVIKTEKKKLLEWFGLALIIGSYFFISKEAPWPGYLAMLPVIGAFLVLQAKQQNSLITTNIFSQKIGAWSYSIYLWHWPLVVAIYYFSLSNIYIYLGMFFSVLLGFLSYSYVEKFKFDNDFKKTFDYLKCKPLYMIFIIGVFGSGSYLSNGFENHYSENLIALSKEDLNRNPYKCMEENKFPCYIGNNKSIKAIIVGDSHADALTTAVAHSVNLKEEGIIALTKASCPFIMNAMSTIDGDGCYQENIRRMEYLENNYINIPVFWVARTGVYLYGQSEPERVKDIRDTQPSIYFTEQYNEATDTLYLQLKNNLNLTIERIRVNHPVYIVQPTPEMRKNVPKIMTKDIILNNELHDLSLDYNLYLQRNKNVRKIINEVANANRIQVLDPIPYLCNDKRCIAQFEGRPIYFDGDHMSEYGNKILIPMFKSAIDKHQRILLSDSIVK